MITISLCMIVKNEEENLPRCLNSIQDLVDEIVIVDTGSTDTTKEIAQRYTNQVFDFVWQDDFSAARNYAFSKGTMEYCMWMDADDVLDPESRKAFQLLKETLSTETDVVMMRYHTAFDETGKPAFTYYRERIIRQGSGYRWEGAIHEAIAPAGNVVYSEAAIIHRKTGLGDPDRNLRIFEGLLRQGKNLSPREQFYYARELTYHGRDEEAAAVFEDFLSGGRGWVENNIEACRNLASCYDRIGQPEKAFFTNLKSFRYAPPRAEICCDLGRFFENTGEYATAAYWYHTALHCKRDDRSGGFVLPDCYDYIPLIQLCVCSYQIGDVEKAEAYNEMAGKIKPKAPAFQFNKAFFAEKANNL